MIGKNEIYFMDFIFFRQMETEDGVLYLDMKCGNLMQQRISRIQTDQAVEIARLIKQYITIGKISNGQIRVKQELLCSR